MYCCTTGQMKKNRYPWLEWGFKETFWQFIKTQLFQYHLFSLVIFFTFIVSDKYWHFLFILDNFKIYGTDQKNILYCLAYKLEVVLFKVFFLHFCVAKFDCAAYYKLWKKAKLSQGRPSTKILPAFSLKFVFLIYFYLLLSVTNIVTFR